MSTRIDEYQSFDGRSIVSVYCDDCGVYLETDDDLSVAGAARVANRHDREHSEPFHDLALVDQRDR